MIMIATSSFAGWDYEQFNEHVKDFHRVQVALGAVLTQS